MASEYDSDEEYDSGAAYDDDRSEPERKQMPKLKVRRGRTKRQSRSNKGNTGDLIISKLTNNTHYPNADGVLDPFTTANTDLKTKQAALDLAEQTVEEKRAAAEAAEAAWDDAFDKVADHAETKAAGNREMLQSAGLEVQNTPAPISEVLAPAKLNARTNGVAGATKLKWLRARGATHYVVQRASGNPNEPASWETLDTVSAASFADTGLTSGTKYWYRVAAKGFAGLSGWSQAVCVMAP